MVIFGRRDECALRKAASPALIGWVHCTRLPIAAIGCAPRPPPCRSPFSVPIASVPPIVSMRSLPSSAIEEAVIGAAAEFAVGDEFEAEAFLQGDGVADGLVFGRGQIVLADFTAGETPALFQQIRRPQQAADMLGAKRRLRSGFCGGNRTGANIHGVSLPGCVFAHFSAGWARSQSGVRDAGRRRCWRFRNCRNRRDRWPYGRWVAQGASLPMASNLV